MGKKVAGWTPPETDVIVESNGNGWTPPPTDEVIEEQPKKKESTSPAGDASVTPVEQPSQPSEQPTASAQPTSEERTDRLIRFAQNEFDTWQNQRLAQVQAEADANPDRFDELNEQFRNEQEAKLTEINETVSRFTTEALKRQKLDIQRKVIEADTAARTRELVEKGGVVNTLKAALNELRGSLRAPADENAPEDPFANALKRGSLSAQLAEIVNPFAGKLTKEDAKNVADLQKEISGLSVSEEYDAFNRAETFGEAVSALSKDPVKIITELTAESMSALATYGATRIAAGAATGAAIGSVVPGGGTAAGAGYGAIAGLGASSYALEYSNKYLETMRELGVDINSAESLEKAFNDPAIVAKARAKGHQKGIPIMIFDMISGGIAGKIVTRPAAGIVRKIAGGAAELGAQAVLGGAGEAAGQLASGERLSPSAIIAEMVGEFGLAPVEITTGALTFNAPTSQTIADQVQKVDPNNPVSIKQAAQTVKQTIDQNATPLREDTGSVPQQGGQPESSQAQGGDDIQQPAPETSQPAPAGQPAQEQIQPQAEGQGLQVAPNTYSVSITPATIRKFDDLTAALKEKSDRYNVLDKQMMDNAESMTDEEFAALQAQRDAIGKEILDQGRAMLQPEIEAIEGVKIQRFGDLKGRWDGRSEPSFDLTVTAPESSLPQLRLKLAAFAEKTSQDAFFVTKPLSSSDQRQMAQVDLINGTTPSGGVSMPLARLLPPRSLSEREKSVVSGILERNGIKDYSVNKDGSVDVMYFDDKRNEQSTNDEIRGRYQEFRTKLETAAAEIHRRGLLSGIGRGFKESWASFSDNAYSGDQRRSYTGVRDQILQGQARITTPDEGKTQTQTQTTPPSSSGVLTGPPPPPTGTSTGAPASQQPTRQTALGARFEASEEPSPIKERVKGRDMYIPRKIIQTDKEAAAILDEWNDNEFAERAIRDTSNEMPGGTRGALAANLYQRYKAAANQATTEQEKTMWYDKAADIGVWAAQNLTKQGQETAIAGKIWKAITSDEDLLVIAMEKSRRQAVTQAVKPIQKGVQEAKGQITEEIERLIRQRVTEGVEAQLQRAKLITKEQKKKISDAFDALKIQKPEGTLGATTLVPEIWNGAVEAIKRAVLAGADLANAVQAGIDYIRTHHKGDFDEADFRAKVTPAVEKLIPKPKVDPSKIDEKKIATPRLSGKKKKNFISDVVDEFNQAGEITDERFEELYAKHLGVKEFSAEDRKIIRDLAKIISDAEKFKEEVKGKLTKANIQKYRKLLERAQEANYQLQQYAQNNPATVWDTLSTILQGNLLAPISIMRNVYSNAALMPLRFMSTAIGSVVDRAITGVAKTGLLGEAYTRIVGKERTISLVGLNRGYFRGGWNGSMEGLRQIVTGQRVDERNLRDISMKFDPNRAIKRWAEKDRSLSQKINDAVEGTLGWSAEAMFRLLNLGDKPFRRAAELARAFELAELKGLKGDDALRFVLFPDEESAQEIDQAGKKATFQDESKVATMIQRTILNILSHLPGPLKVIGKSQIPFVRTPVNILAETLDYAIPPLTLLRGISQISKGNKRSGSILIGKAMTGFMVQQVGLWLLNAGLMTWGGGDDNEGKKAERRSIQYDTEPPNSLNVEAIARGLSGQGWKPKDDDIWIDYKNLGVMGILLQNQANSWYRRKKEEGKQVEDEIPEDRGLTQIFTDIGMDAIKTLSSAFDQSFLQGTSTLIKALEDPEGYQGQKWLLNTTEALTSIVIPRTITAISTASDEYIRDTRDKDTMQALANIFKKNLFMGDRLAARVNLWGEKITGNPEGRSRIPYYLFDVTRFKEVDTDSFKYRLYKKLKEDNFNGDWLPSMPKRTVSIKGVQIPLTNQEYEEFAIEVGQARARKLAAYMSNRPDSRLKVDDVKERYSTGYNQGRTRFMMRRGWNMWSKQKLEKLAAEREK